MERSERWLHYKTRGWESKNYLIKYFESNYLRIVSWLICNLLIFGQITLEDSDPFKKEYDSFDKLLKGVVARNNNKRTSIHSKYVCINIFSLVFFKCNVFLLSWRRDFFVPKIQIPTSQRLVPIPQWTFCPF